MSEKVLDIDDIWLSLASEYSKTFFSMETSEYFKMIGDTKVTIECWVQIYYVLAKRKQLDLLENLPQEHKEMLWNDAKSHLPNESKERTIKLCKAIHAISTYIQL
jgi:hypothetical protein